jgi:glutaredoxin-like protein NrdH
MQNTTPAITVYSKPACVQCTMTKKALEKKGLAFHEVDVTENAAALEYIAEELGYSQAPVVVIDDENHWSGFQPQKIDAVAAALGRTA